MRYPIEHNGMTLLLEPELAGTLYHLKAHPEAPQRVPAQHIYKLRKAGVSLVQVYGRGALLADGEAASTVAARGRIQPGVRLVGRVATVNGTKIVLSPAKAKILRDALASLPVETNQTMHVQAYQMRQAGIPIKYNAAFGGYHVEQEA